MSTYRFLICGTGIAELSCAKVATADDRGTVAGLFDPVSTQLDRARDQYPNAVSGDNYRRLLETVQPDTAVIAGPDHLHAEQAVLAMEHGCHVLVEKPLATTTADARRILEVAMSTGRHVMADHGMRYVYSWREMALAARSGQIGDLFFVQGDYIHRHV
jgi:predicted dehydrogenase